MMDLSYGPEAEAFRAQVRSFLAGWQPRSVAADALEDYTQAFRRAATQAGYL